MKISPRLLYVARDLLAQRLDRRKLDLIPQPVEKANLHFASPASVQWDENSADAFRWQTNSAPNVGRLPTLVTDSNRSVPDARARDVNAVLRHKFFIARQIDGGHGVLRSVARGRARRPQDAERTRQQMPRPAHPSRRPSACESGCSKRVSPRSVIFAVDLDLKSHLLPKFGQQIGVARRPCARSGS